jgi:GNAT superfamily N-acetyltransferase
VNGYEVSTDGARLDRAYIHAFLTTSYWSPGIPRDVVDKAIDNSLNFGVYADSGQQVGYARVVSDFATYAYLADVFIDAGHRGEGLGKHLIAAVVAHPQLQGLRRFALATADAHGLYQQFGWAPPVRPEAHMFIERSPAELWGA